MVKYKVAKATAVGATPQERMVEILGDAGILLRINSEAEVVMVMQYEGEFIVDVDATYLDMIPPDQGITNYG